MVDHFTGVALQSVARPNLSNRRRATPQRGTGKRGANEHLNCELRYYYPEGETFRNLELDRLTWTQISTALAIPSFLDSEQHKHAWKPNTIY